MKKSKIPRRPPIADSAAAARHAELRDLIQSRLADLHAAIDSIDSQTANWRAVSELAALAESIRRLPIRGLDDGLENWLDGSGLIWGAGDGGAD